MSRSVNTGIADEQRGEIVHGLSRVLADSYSLYLKTHSYHSNVVGPMFHSLHATFMDEYTELAMAVDEIAGGYARWERRPPEPTHSSRSSR